MIAMAKDERDVVVQVFFVRDGRLIGREHFHVEAGTAESNGQILNGFVKQFYAGTPFVPHEIWCQEELEDADLIGRFLSERRGQKVRIWFQKGREGAAGGAGEKERQNGSRSG